MFKFLLTLVLIGAIIAGSIFLDAYRADSAVRSVCDSQQNSASQEAHLFSYEDTDGVVGGYLFDLRLPDAPRHLYNEKGIEVGTFGGFINPESAAGRASEANRKRYEDMRLTYPKEREIACGSLYSRTVEPTVDWFVQNMHW